MTQNIQIEKLRHHPSNPRKEIGDLSELADSIKTQGLICPLLVVPHEDEYFVIAGNRRLEACKLAGLEEVNCEVANISDEDAIGVMLTENMLRQNLSTLEESDGFQLMLDMGKDVEQIAKDTGLKEETVKMRAKVSKLDKDKVKKACEAGATIFELAAVADIENEKDRKKLLDKAGTKNFNNALMSLKREKESAQRMIDIEQFLRDHDCEEYSSWTHNDGLPCLFSKDEEGNTVEEKPYCYMIHDYKSWNDDMPDESLFEPDAKYYFVKSTFSISVFRDATAAEYEEQKARSEERVKHAEEQDAVRNAVNEMNKRHQLLREEFVLNYADFKKHQKELKMLLESAFDKYIYNNSGNYGLKDKLDEYMEKADKNLDKMLLLRAYVILEGGSFITTDWKDKHYVIVHKESASLSALYNGLIGLGYQMSEEEEQVMNGTHPIFGKES